MHKYLIIIGLIITAMQFIIIAEAQNKLNYSVKTIDGTEYYLYTVEKSEGWYRISKKFDISQSDLKAANPNIENNLKLGQVIRIPVVKAVTQNNSSTNSETQTEHIIAPKETLYGISHKYGVSIDELIQLNPQVSKKMAIGDKLFIPVKKDTTNKVKTSSILPIKNEISNHSTDSIISITKVTDSILPIRIAYLLPFMLDGIKHDPSTDKFVEFYEGALLAINTAKNRGIKLEINTYDTEKNDIKIQSILAQPELKTMDFIIGPTYSEQVKYVSDFSFANKINTLIPFTSEIADIAINPYLFQFNPTSTVETEVITNALIHFYKEQTKEESILFINISGIEPNKQTQNIQANLTTNEIPFREISLTLDDTDTLQYILDSVKTNILIFNSEKFNIVKKIVAAAAQLQEKYSIEIIGNYSWRTQINEISIPIYYTSLFYHNDDQATREYEKLFTFFYKHKVSSLYPRYDILGYDLTTYIINLLHLYGNNALRTNIPQYKYAGLSCSPIFTQKNIMCGFMNEQIYFMKFANNTQTIIEIDK